MSGDPTAAAVVHVFDAVERREQLTDLPALSLDDLKRLSERNLGQPVI